MKLNAMRRAYLREATLMLVIARLAVLILPAAQVFAWANRPLRRIKRFAADEARWVAWSVETIGAKAWMNALCLPCALAAHAMLRRRGIASRLCLGVARDEGAVAAHAWIEVGQDVIVGGAETTRFTRLTQFGGSVLRS
jgi:hypothetical protein